jgi:hypothetical protein
MDTGRLEREIQLRNAEQNKYAQAAAEDIDQGQNPLMNQGA